MKSIQPCRKGTHGRRQGRGDRRGAVAAQVAICLTALVGFTALTIDVGHMYNVRGELQRSADAAALAAAAELGDWSTGNPKTNADTVAQYFANANSVLGSGVGLDTVSETTRDVTFGRASVDPATNKYVFTPDPDELYPNAVRVRVRRTAGSPSGPVSMFFAQIFGMSTSDVSAQATAVLTPRDIAFALDLSTSHNDDSSLRSYKNTEIANKDVWEALADTEAALDPQTDSLGFLSEISVLDNGDGTSTVTVALTSESAPKALSHVTFGLPSAAQASVEATAWTDGDYDSPSWGLDPTTGVTGLKFDAIGDGLGEDGVVETHHFSFAIDNEDLSQVQMGVATKAGPGVDTSVSYKLVPEVTLGNLTDWGDEVTGPGWDFANDDGLVRLRKGSNWGLSTTWLSQTLEAKGYGTYTTAEKDAINSSAYDSSTSYYRRRVLVGLGIYRWKSGKSGGQPGGDGNGYIASTEVEAMVNYPGKSSNPDTLCKQVGGSWDDYMDYVKSSSSSMCRYSPSSQLYGDSGLQWRYGLKTFVDFLQEKEYGDSLSPGLAGSPQQPMGAVADAVKECFDIIQGLQGGDLVGLASYATCGYGPGDKPSNMSWLTAVSTEEEQQAMEDLIDQLQPGMWTTNTNIAQGIDKGIDVLFNSPDARSNAAKVLVLLTDGIANQTRSNPTYYSTYQAKTDARTAAAEARAQGVRIYTISVGGNADQELMKQIADGDYPTAEPYVHYDVDNHFHAEGSVASYRATLQDIFQKLGGARPVMLIE